MIQCLDMEGMGYFLSLLNPESFRMTAEGIIIGLADVLWVWNETTERWCHGQ